MRNDFFIFGDVDSRKYQIGIYGNQLFDPPEREYEEVVIPGRNGSLYIDKKRYKNKVIPYDAYIVKGFEINVDAFRNDLLSQIGYQRLEDTVRPDEFRLAKALPFEVDMKGVLKAGTFTIKFDAKPQRFLKSGEYPVEYTANGIIYNPTRFVSKPFLRVYGSNSGTVGIGSQTITISSISTYVDIDCDVMNAFKGATNCNGNVSFTGDIELPSGRSGIAFTGGITKVIITPRWFRI